MNILPTRQNSTSTRTRRTRPHVEGLEERLPPSSISGHGFTVSSGVGGIQLRDVVASFQPTNLNLGYKDFTATIRWGDGTSSSTTAPIGSPNEVNIYTFSSLPRTDGGDNFAVEARHVYHRAGVFPILITIHDQQGDSTVIKSKAVVVPEQLSPLFKTPTTLHVTAGVSNSLGIPFVDTAAGLPFSHFHGTINWGDGSRPVAAAFGPAINPQIRSPDEPPHPAPSATVYGSHIYTHPGTYMAQFRVVTQQGLTKVFPVKIIVSAA